MLSTGARFWLAQSAAALYQGCSLKNPFSCESRQFMTRSTGVSGKSEGEITFYGQCGLIFNTEAIYISYTSTGFQK